MNARPAGWYPDPDQVQTQRYWDGEAWTDQRAPLPPPAARTGVELSPRLVLGLVGAAAAAVGVFLPRVDSPTSLHITDNSLIASDVVIGGLVLLFAITGAVAAYQARREPGRQPWLVLAGFLVIAAAIYYGTGDRLELHTVGTSFFSESKSFQGSPGIGLYVTGVGGALLAIAGIVEGSKAAEPAQAQ